ncbi:MAG: hypothetical protein K0Q72_2366 [Armatimonadetes bacterium]|jgi:anti-anti-sigma factor|nr:hypothetical protein [Armatimonadota bacterium]
MSHEHGAHHEKHPRAPADQLTIDRLPGQYGPVVRCTGQLTLPTAGVLQRELDRLGPMRHPVVTINLSGIDFIDVDGVMTLLDAYRSLRKDGTRLALVAGGPFPERLLQILGLDRLLPVFPGEDVAALALRGAGPRPPAPEDWEAARRNTLRRWQAIGEALVPHPEEALRLVTSMTSLCDLSEELFAERPGAADSRCQYCPLFHALGGRRGDLGCRSVLEPIIDAVREGEPERARARIDALTRLIAELPVPERTEAP